MVILGLVISVNEDCLAFGMAIMAFWFHQASATYGCRALRCERVQVMQSRHTKPSLLCHELVAELVALVALP